MVVCARACVHTSAHLCDGGVCACVCAHLCAFVCECTRARRCQCQCMHACKQYLISTDYLVCCAMEVDTWSVPVSVLCPVSQVLKDVAAPEVNTSPRPGVCRHLTPSLPTLIWVRPPFRESPLYVHMWAWLRRSWRTRSTTEASLNLGCKCDN